VKLNNLHKKTPLELALSKNVAVKSMLQPMKKTYWWKDHDKEMVNQPPPPSREGPTTLAAGQGLLAGKPRLEKFFGGKP